MDQVYSKLDFEFTVVPGISLKIGWQEERQGYFINLCQNNCLIFYEEKPSLTCPFPHDISKK